MKENVADIHKLKIFMTLLRLKDYFNEYRKMKRIQSPIPKQFLFHLVFDYHFDLKYITNIRRIKIFVFLKTIIISQMHIIINVQYKFGATDEKSVWIQQKRCAFIAY